VNDLFGSEGLVVVDADHPELKKLLIPVIEDDLFQHSPQKLVDKTNAELDQLGFKTQVNAREINFFYLEKGLRARIEKEADSSYQVVDTDIKFSKEELRKLVKAEPEKFSPNVILRPLYQEIILPNLAYIGGPAEIVYWLQLKSVFTKFNTPFPLLMPRNFALVISPTIQRKLEKTGLTVADYFEEQDTILKNWVLKYSENDLTTSAEQQAVSTLFDHLQKRATKIDSTLNRFLAAEAKRAQISLEKIEKKIIRAEKRLHEDRFRQIEAVKNELFPNGSLQERTDNFLNFYQEDAQFIEKLLESFDPLDYRFNVLHHV
jgi:bacillithiol biosynthesis cysteine-adding enzyme BshC